MHVGSVNSSEEFCDESGDESGIERARTASALSLRGLTADKLDQRSVSHVELVAAVLWASRNHFTNGNVMMFETNS